MVARGFGLSWFFPGSLGSKSAKRIDLDPRLNPTWIARRQRLSMFKFQKFPFALGLRKIAAQVNLLIQDGWIVLGFQHIPAIDGPGLIVVALQRDETPQEASAEPSEIVDETGDEIPADVNGHVAVSSDEPEIIPATVEQPSQN
jgi:hypothetical protein